MNKCLTTILFLSAILIQVKCLQAQQITTGVLIQEMVDLHRLGYFPEPSYKTIQFSSYDHRSKVPAGPEWFANSDGFGKEPVANFVKVIKESTKDTDGKYLICDVAGPGAIVRVWTAAIGGKIQLFLDDAPKPIYDGPAQVFFQRTYQPFLQAAKIHPGILDGSFSQRNAGYYPIPFAKRCRIFWFGKKEEIHFYQVQIRKYGNDAKVITFTSNDVVKYKKEIERVAVILKNPDEKWKYKSKEKEKKLNSAVNPGEDKEIFYERGTKALEKLVLKIQANDLDKALKQTILHIYFDEYPNAQVQSPLGDFFGASPGINPYDSVPFTVKPNGEMVCRYVMPFKENMRINIENKGRQPVTIEGSVLLCDFQWDPLNSMYFRAHWRVDHDLVASNDKVQDLPFLMANGKGVYVGTTSMLLNPNPIPTSYGNWWGEGDEKIFVDDDLHPSTFGTGSEDYYNYAWSSGDLFDYAYCGQPRNDGPANRGFVTNYRWHIIDPLPFQYRINFFMELFSHETTPGVSYARISYHYGRPGLIDDHVFITSEDVRHLSLPENWEPVSRMGARNSTFYPIEEIIPGSPNINLEHDNLWQGGVLVSWKPIGMGDTLTGNFTVEEDGEYTVHFAVERTPMSGMFSAQIDGQALDFGGNIDLLSDYHTLFRVASTKREKKIELKKGKHVLTLRSEGKSERSKGTRIGLDFLWLQK